MIKQEKKEEVEEEKQLSMECLTLQDWCDQLPTSSFYDDGYYSKEAIEQRHIEQYQQEVNSTFTNPGSTFTTNYQFYTRSLYSPEQWKHHFETELPFMNKRTYSLESFFLRQSASYPHPANTSKQLFFNPCINERRCIAYENYLLIDNLEYPIVLSACLDQQEWDLLCQDENQVQTCPISKPSHLCVLCHRYRISLLHAKENRIRFCEGDASILSKPSSTEPFGFDSLIQQFYYNPRNEIDGYNQDAIAEISQSERQDFFFLPIVHNNLAPLSAKVDPCSRYYIDQSMLQYKPTDQLQPLLGENGQHYFKRVRIE